MVVQTTHFRQFVDVAQRRRRRAAGRTGRKSSFGFPIHLVLLGMDANVALGALSSGVALEIGAEYGCGGHDGPPDFG
jgi:hypothetical protein